MARLASEAKAGFYATPPEEMELVLRALHVGEHAEDDPFFIYDPCCGEGVALQMIQDVMKGFQAKVVSYGSEIEEGRVDDARERLDVVLHEAYQNVRTESKFSLLWLNPPYQENVDGERTELTFLRALTDLRKGVLQKGGILLFCIPQHVLVDTAGVLSGRFRDMSIYRFTDNNYEVFKQVVVVAKFDRAPISEQKKAFKALQMVGRGNKQLVPTLDKMEPFIVPACATKDPPYYRAGMTDPKELAKDLQKSPLLEELVKRVVPKNRSSILKRPMLPLKPAHMGIAIAAGAVGGNMGNHSAHCS